MANYNDKNLFVVSQKEDRTGIKREMEWMEKLSIDNYKYILNSALGLLNDLYPAKDFKVITEDKGIIGPAIKMIVKKRKGIEQLCEIYLSRVELTLKFKPAESSSVEYFIDYLDVGNPPSP